MTIPVTARGTHPHRLLRSTAAVLLGFVAVVVLSLGTDQVLHVLQVYPPWGQPMYDPGLNLLALAYRSIYTSAGESEERCGWLKDRFGLSWQVIPTGLGKMLADIDRAKGNRVMQAMLQMNKIDIAKLKQAYDRG